ncbi:MAG TPA: hypothetical protein VGI79_14555 [Caulobacteraceae bacterium]|jgi:hypothetical protein
MRTVIVSSGRRGVGLAVARGLAAVGYRAIAIACLTGEGGRNITGAVMTVDGGSTA